MDIYYLKILCLNNKDDSSWKFSKSYRRLILDIFRIIVVIPIIIHAVDWKVQHCQSSNDQPSQSRYQYRCARAFPNILCRLMTFTNRLVTEE